MGPKILFIEISKDWKLCCSQVQVSTATSCNKPIKDTLFHYFFAYLDRNRWTFLEKGSNRRWDVYRSQRGRGQMRAAATKDPKWRPPVPDVEICTGHKRT